MLAVYPTTNEVVLETRDNLAVSVKLSFNPTH